MSVLFLLALLFITGGNCDDRVKACTLCLPHTPHYGDDYYIPYNEITFASDSYVFPSDDDLHDYDYTNHFFGLFNFNDAPNGTFFIGARNILYQFNKTTLQPTEVFNWSPFSWDVANCENKASDPEIACENYVRLYKKLPFNDDEERLLVCGTGAFNVTCRTIRKDNINDTNTHGPSTPRLTSGIISLHPLYPFHGDFLDNPNNGYDATGYFEVNNPESFTMARYNVSYNPTTDGIQFTSTNTRNGVDGIGFSINNPYYPVKLIKQDLDGTLRYKMFYFFIREKKYYDVVSDAVPARARIIRICQNDLGFADKFYRTFVKFEMLCYGENLKIQAAVGTQEHYYTVLRDVIQTSTPSRWYGNARVWHIMVYTLFTADVYGPNGTAICVYHAHFAGGNSGFLDLGNRGIIDVFSYNDYKDELGDAGAEEEILDCDEANKRSNNDYLISGQYITQYRGLQLPLMESQGEVFTKMVAEQVCVKQNGTTDCLMQDVLFIGTNDGRVKKIVFTTVSNAPERAELHGLTHDAIVAQEWKLADDNSIEQIEVQDNNLYIATYTRLYTFPKANCSRHMSCKVCVGSRDPYCYWDIDHNECKQIGNNVGVNGGNDTYAFPSNALQNIHTGEDSNCLEYPICDLTMSAISGKSFEILGLDQCNYTNSFIVTMEPYEHCDTPVVTAALNKSNTFIESNDIRGRRLYNVIVTAIGDNGNSSYSERIISLNGAPVAPKDEEVVARAINSSFVEVVVSLDGCNIHDKLDNYRACVEFIGTSLSCQDYSGVNTFVGGPYNGSQRVDYVVTIENNYGTASAPSATVTTRASQPSSPNNLTITATSENSVSLLWEQDSGVGNNNITGYSIYVNDVKRTDCSTTDKMYTINGLYSYTQYNFLVVSCSEGGESEPVQVSTTTSCERPSRIQNIYVSTQTHNELTFQWEKPMYANGTSIMYRVMEECYNKSSLMIVEEDIETNDTVYTITHLQPLTRCCISVTAVSVCNDREYEGEIVLHCNLTTDGIPGPVEQLTLTPHPDSILVRWAPPYNYTDPSLRYNVNWKAENSDINYSYITLDQLYFFIEDLEQFTTYTIRVNAFSSEGSGTVKYAEGLTLPDIPTRPEDVEITFDQQCSMTVNWEHNATEGYKVTNYRIRAYCNEVSFEGIVSSEDRSVTFSDICSNGIPALTWCTAQVQANNTVGYGLYSELVEEMYPPSAPPTPSSYTGTGIDGIRRPSLFEQYCCVESNRGKTLVNRISDREKQYIICSSNTPASCSSVYFPDCSAILTNHPSAASGYYNIMLANGTVITAYCDMEGVNCDGEGGWMRVAYLNMSDPSEQCPPGFRLYEENSTSTRACGRNYSGCQSVIFSSYDISYTRVCGRVIGYQKGSPDALHVDFGLRTVDQPYVDGVSITRGSLREHIWTFMAALHENVFLTIGDHECPCAPNSPVSPPSFMGNDYFCESGQPGAADLTTFHTADPLWDGKQCGLIEEACCNVTGIPWFNKVFQQPTTDYIELRVCGNEDITNEDSPVGYYEIYAK